ncbi:MAG TPA: hypothetical protein VFN30_01970 [Chitinophagaceae bacterium]|nr:hypothetical protein [Chitinophagaceae bacterium]
MKKLRLLFSILLLILICAGSVTAQCSVCTKTASQLGTQAAKGLNAGIVYLMVTPFLIVGYLSYRWWQGNKN